MLLLFYVDEVVPGEGILFFLILPRTLAILEFPVCFSSAGLALFPG
jgi:hypothetical protein